MEVGDVEEVEEVEGVVDDGFDCDDLVVPVVLVVVVVVVDDPRGARMKSAAKAIQPVYAKLTIVLMSERSYLYTTRHTPKKKETAKSASPRISEKQPPEKKWRGI